MNPYPAIQVLTMVAVYNNVSFEQLILCMNSDFLEIGEK